MTKEQYFKLNKTKLLIEWGNNVDTYDRATITNIVGLNDILNIENGNYFLKLECGKKVLIIVTGDKISFNSDYLHYFIILDCIKQLLKI